MSLPTMTGTGRLTAPVELRFTASGMAVATMNLAFNSRKRDTNGDWIDGDVFFVRATAFKQLAENLAETVDKGVEVHVSGRLKTEQWTDKQTGDKRSAVSLLVDSIGPNLAYAVAKVNKAARSGGGDTTGGSADPWANTSDTDSAPF